MLRSAKKCRMMGSAALDIAYVACGRLDVYVEGSISLWDVAAGVLLLERAGGKVVLKPHETDRGKILDCCFERTYRAWRCDGCLRHRL